MILAIKRILVLNIILLFTVFTSCQYKTEEPIIEEVEVVDTNSFEYKLEHEPKIFLKYWAGMTFEQYKQVSEILIKEGVLKPSEDFRETISGIYIYVTGKTNLKIFRFSFVENYKNSFRNIHGHVESRYENDIVDGVMLVGFDEINYNTFKEKYNLPQADYVEKEIYTLQEYSEPPRDFKSVSSMFPKERILTKDEIDNINSTRENEGKEGLLYSSKRLTVRGGDIIREKENTIVIFTDIYGYDKPSSIYYNEKGMYADKKLETRLIENKTSTSYFSVTYTSKDRYENIKKISQKKEDNYEAKQNKELQQKQKRENNIKDEI